MSGQLVKVTKEPLATCMKCPLCKKLISEATTISLCLHTFCRKCIYKQLSDDEVDSCPVCDIDLGCNPVDKLRADHTLEDIRSKLFPYKTRKTKTLEVLSPSSVSPPPVKRKERYLSSLVTAPEVPARVPLTGRTKKPSARKMSLRGSSSSSMKEQVRGSSSSSMKEHVRGSSSSSMKEYVRGSSSSSSMKEYAASGDFPEKLQRNTSPGYPSRQEKLFNKEVARDKEIQMWERNANLWKPLNCLVEAANSTKPSKLCLQDTPVPGKPQPSDFPDYDNVRIPKTRTKEQPQKSKPQQDTKFNNEANQARGRSGKRKSVLDRNNASGGQSSYLGQSMIGSMGAIETRPPCPIWFSLVALAASRDQPEIEALPQISVGYLRVKDVTLPVSYIQKYLMKKLDLPNEHDIEITCQGHLVHPELQLQNLLELWLKTLSSPLRNVSAPAGSSAKEYVMVLNYCRKIQPN